MHFHDEPYEVLITVTWTRQRNLVQSNFFGFKGGAVSLFASVHSDYYGMHECQDWGKLRWLSMTAFLHIAQSICRFDVLSIHVSWIVITYQDLVIMRQNKKTNKSWFCHSPVRTFAVPLRTLLHGPRYLCQTLEEHRQTLRLTNVFASNAEDAYSPPRKHMFLNVGENGA